MINFYPRYIKYCGLIPVLLASILTQSSFAQAVPVLSLTPVITTGLSSPIQLVNANDGSKRIFIVQKGGAVLAYDSAYHLIGTFLTVTTLGSGNERGLLSMAFHPDYANNGFCYVYYTNTAGNLELARYKVSANPNVADNASKVIVKTIPHPTNSNHNGGELHFGKDGYLYLSTGDGGGAGDVPGNAQNTSVLLGKILRFAVNTSAESPFYTIPSGEGGNPFGNEVFAYGLRNPFRWSFDRLTGDMWIGDVGQDSWEEIDYRRVDSISGTNFGWRCYEGNVTYNTTVGCTGPLSKYVFPVYTYPTQAPSAAITGGNVYRGTSYTALKGYYVGVDFFSGIFYKVRYDTPNSTWITNTQTLSPTGIADFGETEDGELYVVTLTGNAVYRVASSGPVQYIFNGNGNWEDAANWYSNLKPPTTLPADSEILIDPPANGECVLNSAQTIATGAKLTVNNDKQFRVTGNLTIQ